MIDKILFWLDFDLLYFGIAKSLSEKYTCDLFAIIDINNFGKKFFLGQNFVKFQKVWYYRDYIAKENRKSDLKYLREFENKYGINLWNLAYSERLFYKYNEYHKFTRDEILLIFEQECKFFESVLDEIKPNFLILRLTDFNQNELLYQICKSRGIKIIMLGLTRTGDRYMLSSEADKIDRFIADKDITPKENKSFEELLQYFKGYSQQQLSYFNSFQSSRKNGLKAILRFFLLVCNNNYRKYYANYGRTRLRVFTKQISLLIKKRYRASFLNKHALRIVSNEKPYVYFPFHQEPERSLSLTAPFFTNQLEVIAHIAKSIPIEYEVYVKEHPAQASYGWRNISYYKQIIEMPNVRLIHPSVSNEEMLKKCSLVVTIAGTSGLEAAFYKKPAIVLTDVIFSDLPSVYRLKKIEDLPQAIRTMLGKQVDLDALNSYINRVLQNSFDYGLTPLFMKMWHYFYYGGFLFDVDIFEQKMNNFLQENKSVFENITFEFIKKINQYKQNMN